ncbi:MAG: TIGR00266 family protein [Proteobacteria bacterium]|nr:TIGR00266 family protein [Pseudomonadota bacterium]
MTEWFHKIEYEINGSDIQFVEIFLDPEETVIAESGTMMFMQSGIQFDTRMTDGSAKNSGFVGGLISLAKRKLTGENLFLTFYTNTSDAVRSVAFAPAYPGTIVPIDLAEMGGKILCQKRAFLCAAKGISIDVGITKKLSTGFFGGDGFILQKLSGDGLAFIHAGGTVTRRTLEDGEIMYVDTGSLVAMQPSVQFEINFVSGINSLFFGGEGMFLTRLTGPGHVWVQSMPYSRYINSIAYAIANQPAVDTKDK